MIHKMMTLGVGTLIAAAAAAACRAPEPETTAPAVESVTPAPAPAVELSPAERLEGIRTRLESVKASLNEQGEYNCCVQPACDWCALHEGSCECFNNVQQGEAVCPGCGLGWHNGEGIVDGVDADAVEWNITHEHPAGGHAH